jgi:hypothetical protein
LVLRYHGCSREIGEAILRGDEQLRVSVNEYDWLGSGIYFWETNPIRGLQWANEAVKRKKFDEPFVVGAVIDLGYCFDLDCMEKPQSDLPSLTLQART